MQLPAAEASGPRPKKCWLLTLHPPVSACRMVTCVTPCQCLTSLSDPIRKSRKMQLPVAEASGPRPKKCWLLTLHPHVSACRMVTCVTPCQCLTSLSDPIRKSRKMQLPAAEASSPRPKKCWLLTVSACRMVTCVTPCQCLTSLSDPIRKSRKMQLPAAEASGPRPKKCWLLTLHPPVSACRMVTCVTPCQCLTSLSDPIRKPRKMQLPAAEASGPRPKKCWLLTLHPPVSACRLVTCVTPCQCLTSLSDPIRKSRKMQLPAAEASGPSQSSVGRSVCLPACLPLSVCLSACLPGWLAVCLCLVSGAFFSGALPQHPAGVGG